MLSGGYIMLSHTRQDSDGAVITSPQGVAWTVGVTLDSVPRSAIHKLQMDGHLLNADIICQASCIHTTF